MKLIRISVRAMLVAGALCSTDPGVVSANSYLYGDIPPGCAPAILSVLNSSSTNTNANGLFGTSTGTGTTGAGGSGTGSSVYSGTVAAAEANGLYGNGSCALLTEALAPGVGTTSTWVAGAAVQGNSDLQIGTAIATFQGADGGYNTADLSQHTGIYEGQDAGGMYILEQYQGLSAPQVRYIPWTGNSSSSTAVNQGQNYYVIGHA